MQVYENLVLDEERALYGIENALVKNCRFEGPADGESALKECRRVTVENCHFALRYPLWHLHGGRIENAVMTDTCRAALWYDEDVTLKNCRLGGIKALRECDRSVLEDCRIDSKEFGWFCRDLKIKNSALTSEYPFMHAGNLVFDGLNMKGKYSFQYVKNAHIVNSVLDTKDAFWHAENVTVENCVVKGEYLAWYSRNVKFINCQISGTQPLCYAQGLELKNCTMTDTDLAFEHSDVKADIRGAILSVKNPKSGSIQAESIGDVILDPAYASLCAIRCMAPVR